MTCVEFLKRYTEFRDGLLTAPGEARRFARHLAECPHCRNYEGTLQRGVQALQAADVLVPSADFRARLESRLRSEGLVPGSQAPGARGCGGRPVHRRRDRAPCPGRCEAGRRGGRADAPAGSVSQARRTGWRPVRDVPGSARQRGYQQPQSLRHRPRRARRGSTLGLSRTFFEPAAAITSAAYGGPHIRRAPSEPQAQRAGPRLLSPWRRGRPQGRSDPGAARSSGRPRGTRLQS